MAGELFHRCEATQGIKVGAVTIDFRDGELAPTVVPLPDESRIYPILESGHPHRADPGQNCRLVTRLIR